MFKSADYIRETIANAGSRFVTVNFIKQDGSERTITFNPRHIGEIKGTGHALKDPDAIQNLFKVMDVRLNQWRSFDARRVVSIRALGETTIFQDKN